MFPLQAEAKHTQARAGAQGSVAGTLVSVTDVSEGSVGLDVGQDVESFLFFSGVLVSPYCWF